MQHQPRDRRSRSAAARRLTNVEAVAATLTAMREAGRLDATDSATVVVAESLARAVDDDPGNASLWREFRAALNDLRGVGASDADRDEISQIIEALRSGSQVGNSSSG